MLQNIGTAMQLTVSVLRLKDMLDLKKVCCNCCEWETVVYDLEEKGQKKIA